MFFRFWRRRKPLEKRWLELAKGLGLGRADDGEILLQELLDLPAGAKLGPVLESAGAPTVRAYLFYYIRPTNERSRQLPCVTGCLLVSQEKFSPVSWRAVRKVHNVISSLQASATGGQIVLAPDDAEFNETVTVVAREEQAVVGLLGPAVRRVLERIVGRVEAPPLLTVAEERILLTAPGQEVELDAAEFILSDVLSLYAALTAQSR
ncbi:MAG TPA: hypothetical protein VF168_14070 [Trueperaceae bacterium]